MLHISQAVLVRDIMEEFLRIQRASEEQGEIAVCGFYDVRNQRDGIFSGERVLVVQAILCLIGNIDSGSKAFRDLGKKSWVY